MPTTLCANTQLARALIGEDTRARRVAGELLWDTPDILSWSAWLRRRWDTLVTDPSADLPLLLDARQERLVWEQVIAESHPPSTMVDASAAARLASAAHGLVRAYRIPDRGPLYRVSDDAAAFEVWQMAFMRICEREGWIPASALADYVGPVSGSLTLAGFNGDLTPQQTELLAQAQLNEQQLPALATNAEARLFADAAEERSAAARWASAIHQASPQASIAIFTFDLAGQRAAWDEAFSRDFHGPYAIAAGLPLGSLPLAASALSLLEMVDAEISVAAAGAILLSPYVAGHAEEQFARAAMDERLRKAGGPSIPLWRMARHDICPLFHRMLARWIEARERLPNEQSPSAWAREFHQLLSHFGWPGDRRMNAVEFPVYEAWRDALASFAGLDRVQGAIPAWRARQLLTGIVNDAPFDDGTGTAAAVTIHRAPEPMGATYDHVWIAGAHDGVWPPPVTLNPFLPPSVQRQYGVAGAIPADVLRRARRWTLQATDCAPDIVVSAAEAEKKEPRRLSALFAHLPRTQVEPSASAWKQPLLEELADENAPAPAPGTQRGGVRLFQFQAQCPFHAFAELRLHARELEEPHLGFDKRKQGTALHGALANCWKDLGDWKTLDGMGAEALRELVAGAVDRVLTEEWRAETRLRIGMRDVERERLIEILGRWLREERQRAPFKVLAHEQKADVELAGLTVGVRADRIDELPDGRQILIDYKTTAPSTASWKGERITEPQLPLYAVTSGKPIGATVFAQVNPEKMFFRGVANEKKLLRLSKHEPLDQDVLANWKTALETVAREFLSGVAHVDWAKDSCTFCKLASLCRKDELKRAAAGGDDGE